MPPKMSASGTVATVSTTAVVREPARAIQIDTIATRLKPGMTCNEARVAIVAAVTAALSGGTPLDTCPAAPPVTAAGPDVIWVKTSSLAAVSYEVTAAEAVLGLWCILAMPQRNVAASVLRAGIVIPSAAKSTLLGDISATATACVSVRDGLPAGVKLNERNFVNVLAMVAALKVPATHWSMYAAAALTYIHRKQPDLRNVPGVALQAGDLARIAGLYCDVFGAFPNFFAGVQPVSVGYTSAKQTWSGKWNTFELVMAMTNHLQTTSGAPVPPPQLGRVTVTTRGKATVSSLLLFVGEQQTEPTPTQAAECDRFNDEVRKGSSSFVCGHYTLDLKRLLTG